MGRQFTLLEDLRGVEGRRLLRGHRDRTPTSRGTAAPHGLEQSQLTGFSPHAVDVGPFGSALPRPRKISRAMIWCQCRHGWGQQGPGRPTVDVVLHKGRK